MPIDRPRLDSAIAGMTTARGAYDAALRAYSEAEQLLVLNPADAAARARVERAKATLATARTRLAQARDVLDAQRIEELQAVDTSAALLGSIPGQHVLALFPVAIEARLEPGRLRLRVWPDNVSTSTHDPRLTEAERNAATSYWRAEGAAAGEEQSRAAWTELAAAIGVTRAAWAARLLTPANHDELGPGVAPVFPPVPMQDEEAPFVPRGGAMPDRWIAVGMRNGVKVFEQVSAPIPHDLAVGLDTTPAETQALSNREGEPIQLPRRSRWLTDFALAVQVGMAFDIPLAADVDRLDELFVFGVRITESPAHGATALAELFTGHRFSRGLAFVAQNTPTNNSAAGGSGLPAPAERAAEAFLLERRPRTFAPDLRSNGLAAARAFGAPPDLFASLSRSGAAGSVSLEPDGFEPEASHAMQTALWSVSLGSFLENFLQLSAPRVNALRTYFLDYVRASGPIPAIRVGRQPYGVLPVTALSDFVAVPSEGIDPMLPRLLKTIRTWFAMRREPAIFNGSSEDALRHLGRSARLYAETTPQNFRQSGENRSASLARSLAVASRNSIPNTWRTGPILAVDDEVPQPVSRPIVDDATKDECAALATSPLNTVFMRPAPSSVLGRMVRQAAMLEWSRFAREAIEAAVDIPSRNDLREKAAASGSGVYMDVLVNAFSKLGGTRPPVGPVGPIRDARMAVPRPPIDPLRPRDPLEPPEPPEPPEPRPPRPPPPPPPGEPEINETERQNIAALVGNLANPLATCPGAARLASFRGALARLADFPAGRLELELFGLLDVCNHRADAWFTSLAARRLATLRDTTPEGIVIGGWGCLQDVRRGNAADPQQRAEFIHAPSLDQAAAAAVMRSAARRASAAGSAHAEIDLSSRRVRLARWILEGVRGGRSLGELLGTRFERAVKGTPGEAQLPTLRARFGSPRAVGVLDGLALQQEGPPSNAEASVVHAAEGLSDALDAVADALTAESVYQIVKGHPESALTTLEGIANGEQPPALTVTESPAPGVRLTHRIAISMPAGFEAPGWTVRDTVRAKAEPLLDAWCGVTLGPADATTVTVEDGHRSVAVPLSALEIAAIDVVLSCRDGVDELIERIVRAAVAIQPDLSEPRVMQDRAWKELTGLCRTVAGVLVHGDALRADTFEPPSALGTAADEEFGDLPARVAGAVTELSASRDALLARTDLHTAALRAAAFGIRVPGAPLGAQPSSEQLGALLAATESRLAAAATGSPRDRLRALFGGDLPGVVTFTPRDPSALATASEPPPASLFGSDRLAPAQWLDAVARTHPNTARLAEVLLRLDMGERPAPAPLVAQAPWTPGDRWIATSFSADGGRIPAGRLSVLIHAPAGFNSGLPLGGLLIDAWTELIPARQQDTAMALRFNNAGTRAPQVILLAVSPDPSKAWTTDTLVDVLSQTLMMTRFRMQPSTTMSQGGHMPLVYLGRRPADTGISFSL